MKAQQKQPKIRHRRAVVLAQWSGALVESARAAALHLHDARPRLDQWEGPSGYLERRVTVRGAQCAACGRKIPAGTLALYGDTGDVRRTAYPRYLHLERCTGRGVCATCAPQPCRCRSVHLTLAPEAPSVESLAALGCKRPDLLTLEQIRELCLVVKAEEQTA